MRRVLCAFALVFLLQNAALADTLVLKSGDNKGKVVEETDSLVFLQQADGLVVEVPKEQISILDKDPASAETPRKKPHKLVVIAHDPSSEGQTAIPNTQAVAKIASEHGMSFEAVTAAVERWFSENPQLKKMSDLMHGAKDRDDKLGKMVESTQDPA